jgi:ABC-type cobalamin/Fe3+-siderophores transport system ATPase subunit
MRLDRVFIDGFKNLRNVDIDFDESRLTTVIIGQNGAGKSNLIEAITDIFRFVDLNRLEPPFRYELDYRIGSHKVRLSNRSGKASVIIDGENKSRAAFERGKSDFFPDLVFGYYSGGSRRLEKLFDSHQRNYYDDIKTNDDPKECAAALERRRLFYCRPIHGVFALLSFFAFPDRHVATLLRDPLGITGFHSALALFRKPWFAKSRRLKPEKIWGAGGPAGGCARAIRDVAFHPLVLEDRTLDDYRDKGGNEMQFAAFMRDLEALRGAAKIYEDDREMFYALEATDISDLFRTLFVWVTRVNDASGDVSFADLSDGERQLLMVLGLIRISRGKRALFLLDEPDTHLNPVWQHSYLTLIRKWTGLLAEEANCHIVMTSHNPLTIAALNKEEVRVMFTDDAGQVTVSAPYTDPKGMGFTATLTEIFGLPSSLDPETQKMVDERNVLARIDERSDSQDKALIAINDKLNRLGFMFEDREPLYQAFLRAVHDVRYADRPPLSPESIEKRQAALRELVRELQEQKRSTQ